MIARNHRSPLPGIRIGSPKDEGSIFCFTKHPKKGGFVHLNIDKVCVCRDVDVERKDVSLLLEPSYCQQ
jgi:hypothetical protein